MTTIKIVNKGCDIYPLGSYHEVLGDTETTFKVKPHDYVLKDWCDFAKMPTLTLSCNICGNTFSVSHEFKTDVNKGFMCIRCWERHNIVNQHKIKTQIEIVFYYDCPKCSVELSGSFSEDAFCKHCAITYQTEWDYLSGSSLGAWLTGKEVKGYHETKNYWDV